MNDIFNSAIKNNGIYIIIFTGLLLPFLLHIIKDKYNKRKKIKIEAEEIYNVNNLTGVPERVNDSTNQYSNLIYHKVTVKAVTPEVISSITLNKISKKENKLADIRYDGGFYENKQKHLLIAYNNGNLRGETGDINVTVWAIKNATMVKVKLRSFTFNSLELSPGEVIGKYKVDLLEYKDSFKNNEEFTRLEIQFEDHKNSIPEAIALYNRDTDCFEVNMGSAGQKNSIQKCPCFVLSKTTQEEVLPCSQPVKGISDVCFMIFVKESCVLSYTVELKSGSKIIKSNISTHIKIRIPNYKQEKTRFYGCFYYLISNHNPDLLDFIYSWDTVKKLQTDLVFDKHEAAEKYVGVKF